MNDKVLQAVIKLKDEISKPLKSVKQNMENLNKSAGETKKKLSDFTGGMNQVGKSCAVAGAAINGAIGGIFAASSKVGMEFEASMSKVQAVMGASVDELKTLEKAARDAGAKTTKSASEAANALEYMGLAGWSVKESQEALMPVLRLSEAGAMDLGLTSDLVTDSMSSLGLKMSEVGQSGLNEYLDMVAKTSNTSNTSIQQLMEGLIIVGGTAKNLNVPMEELNAIMGVMANRGLKGTESATALNSVLINMTTGVGQAGEAMEALGLNAFNADGSFKGLGNVFAELNGKLKGMTDEQKNFYLAMIGGKTQVDALQKILDGVGDEYEDLKGKIVDSQGALNTMADVMNDNSKGSITQLKSALEEAGIAIYQTLKPAIAEVTEKIQQAVNWFNGLDDSTKKNIATFGMIALGVGAFLLVLGILAPIIAGVSMALSALGTVCGVVAGIFAFLCTPVGAIIGIILAVQVAVMALKYAWENNFMGIRDKTQVVMDFVKSKIESIKNTFETVKAKCSEFVESIKNMWQGIKESITNNPIVATVTKVVNNVTGKSDKGQKSAWGTKRVVGNDVPYRLHDGERVLTRTEADRYDKGQNANSINVVVNGLTVREESDINKIASQLLKKINESKIVYGGAY